MAWPGLEPPGRWWIFGQLAPKLPAQGTKLCASAVVDDAEGEKQGWTGRGSGVGKEGKSKEKEIQLKVFEIKD